MQSIPGMAVATLPLPFGTAMATTGAYKSGFYFSQMLLKIMNGKLTKISFSSRQPERLTFQSIGRKIVVGLNTSHNP
jgi:hypothetical protein